MCWRAGNRTWATSNAYTHSEFTKLYKNVFLAGLDRCCSPALSRKASRDIHPVPNSISTCNHIISAASDLSSPSVASSQNALSLSVSTMAVSSSTSSVASTPAPAPAPAQGRRLFRRWGTSTASLLSTKFVFLSLTSLTPTPTPSRPFVPSHSLRQPFFLLFCLPLVLDTFSTCLPHSNSKSTTSTSSQSKSKPANTSTPELEKAGCELKERERPGEGAVEEMIVAEVAFGEWSFLFLFLFL
ncbi:hypothetical protein K438DRAFT_1997505 [Mycena galopus ATCC 62051]|nr:hypothetical protein K438DRAFT_1997505 [Mycena galopus ATCC 62051]